MGRFLSTVYRFIIVVVSVSALVLSILSATSCAFVKFDHQYKSEGRYLLDSDANNDAAPVVGDGRRGGLERELQDSDPADEASGPASGGESPPESNVTAPGLLDNLLDNIANTNITLDETEEQVTTTIATMATTAATDLTLVGKTEDLAAGSPAEAASTDVPVPSPEPSGDTPAPSPDFAETSEEPEEFVPQFPADPTDTNEGASASEFTDAAKGAAAPVATAAGYAGLYCNGEQRFSATNIFHQSAQELAEELGEMSDFNQSEEIARGAAVAACVFGLVAAFIVTLTSIIGWRMCCERVIVGFVAIAACVSQGLTFLFFNSERYCDGDIVNEILNQEPCVVGQGGLLSAIAIAAYAIIALMACRLPQDDPYGLCCKKRSAARAERKEGSKFQGSASGGGSKFGLLGKSDGGGPDMPNSPEERDRPNWLSEDAKKQNEENEII